jgi:hypothetical protein
MPLHHAQRAQGAAQHARRAPAPGRARDQRATNIRRAQTQQPWYTGGRLVQGPAAAAQPSNQRNMQPRSDDTHARACTSSREHTPAAPLTRLLHPGHTRPVRRGAACCTHGVCVWCVHARACVGRYSQVCGASKCTRHQSRVPDAAPRTRASWLVPAHPACWRHRYCTGRSTHESPRVPGTNQQANNAHTAAPKTLPLLLPSLLLRLLHHHHQHAARCAPDMLCVTQRRRLMSDE